MSIGEYLQIAGVPPELHQAATECLGQAEVRAKGLLWHKAKVRLLHVSRIADALDWADNRLIDVRPDWASRDVAPMLNITANGDNIVWAETPEGGRPQPDCWLNPDPASDEYQEAVARCYWAEGHHPRSPKARKAWYRRNGGEYRAWRLGMPVDPTLPVERWQGQDGRLSVRVVRCGDAWIVNTERKYGPLVLRGRHGFEVDNLFTANGEQAWYPLPGYQLRAPVTWSTTVRRT